jgi:hypothetical protein
MTLNLLTQSIRKMRWTALALTVFAATLQPTRAQMNDNSPELIEFSVDVAEDMELFTEPRVPVGTKPLRGSFFITEGKVFPAGTIPATNGGEFDPKTAAGAIGTWFCKGTFLVSGSVFDKSPLAVFSDQVYLFPNDQQSIATTGTEGAGGDRSSGSRRYGSVRRVHGRAEPGIPRFQQDRRCQPARQDQPAKSYTVLRHSPEGASTVNGPRTIRRVTCGPGKQPVSTLISPTRDCHSRDSSPAATVSCKFRHSPV